MKDKMLNQFQIYKEFFKCTKKQIKQKNAVLFDEEYYSMMEAPLSNGQTVGSFFKDAKTCGKCHYYALMLAYAMQHGKLVRGVLHRLDFELSDGGSYEEFEHSWVEVPDDLVLDPTAKAAFDKEAYFKTFNAEVRQEIRVSEILSNPQLFEKLATEAADKAYSCPLEKQEKISLFPELSNLQKNK